MINNILKRLYSSRRVITYINKPLYIQPYMPKPQCINKTNFEKTSIMTFYLQNKNNLYIPKIIQNTNSFFYLEKTKQSKLNKINQIIINNLFKISNLIIELLKYIYISLNIGLLIIFVSNIFNVSIIFSYFAVILLVIFFESIII